jgi:ABC-type microcin C transport system permease subunit YejE
MTDDFGIPKGPNADFWFGADGAGRGPLRPNDVRRADLAARRNRRVGARVAIGTTIGLIAGYFGKWADTTLSRGADVMLAHPVPAHLDRHRRGVQYDKEGCLHGLIPARLDDRDSRHRPVLLAYVARVVRGNTLSLKEKEFIEASRSIGAGGSRILLGDVLPNLIAPIIVLATLLVPQSILFEAALSYLGLGVPPDQASWGQILADASGLYDVAWWLMVFPGAFLVITTLAFNLLGDGLRDALDVRTDR